MNKPTTELTYLEKYPIDYCYGPTDEDIRKLNKRIKKHEQMLKKKKCQK